MSLKALIAIGSIISVRVLAAGPLALTMMVDAPDAAGTLGWSTPITVAGAANVSTTITGDFNGDGITDFAAIEYRDEERILASASDPEAAYREVVLPAKIALYKRYLAERSLRTDVSILARTLLAILR